MAPSPDHGYFSHAFLLAMHGGFDRDKARSQVFMVQSGATVTTVSENRIGLGINGLNHVQCDFKSKRGAATIVKAVKVKSAELARETSEIGDT